METGKMEICIKKVVHVFNTVGTVIAEKTISITCSEKEVKEAKEIAADFK